MTTQVHPFERAGLGKAPFRYVGIVAQEIHHGQAVVGSVGGIEITTHAGGTCDFCGHAILDMFRVESADGQTFKVGCDCIHKVDGVLATAIKTDAKAAKEAREDTRIDTAKTHLGDWGVISQPHPNQYRAKQGDTLGDYCRWMFRNAGRSGKLTAARMIERAIATKVED